MCDLLVCAPRLWSSETGPVSSSTAGESCGVAITDGRILAAGPLDSLPAAVVDGAKRRLQVEGEAHTLLPGLIDLHCHFDPTGGEISRYGLDPDTAYLPRGVTTVLSQGDAGADTWPAMATALESCKTRCLMALNLLRVGELPSYFADGLHADGEDLEDFDVDACVAAIESGGAGVWGVDLNVGHNHGTVEEMAEATRRAVAAAERTGKPILYGMRRDSDGWSFEEQLAPLRAGDVVTYVYRSTPHNIVSDGAVSPSIVAARQRGLLFDIGHGGTAFDMSVAQTCLAAGFPPDTISSDNHCEVPAPPDVARSHDLALTMSKLAAAGMPHEDVFRAVTSTPAEVLELGGEIGTLQPGSCADLCLLRWEGEGSLEDAFGNVVSGGRWEPVLTVRAGEVVHVAPELLSGQPAKL